MSEQQATVAVTERKIYEVGERSINDIVRDLSQDIPKKYLSFKKLGGKEITFISWTTATKFLDYYAPGWTYEVKSIQHIKDKIVLIVRLGIPTTDGMIWREATGNEDTATDNFGECFSNSESMALRRAAVKFGLARYLYNKK